MSSVCPELVEAVWNRLVERVPEKLARLSRLELVEAAVELAERSAVELGRSLARLELARQAATAGRPGERPLDRHGRMLRHLRIAGQFDARCERTMALLDPVVRAIGHRSDLALVRRAGLRRFRMVRRRIAARRFFGRHPQFAFLRPWSCLRRKGVAR